MMLIINADSDYFILMFISYFIGSDEGRGRLVLVSDETHGQHTGQIHFLTGMIIGNMDGDN